MRPPLSIISSFDQAKFCYFLCVCSEGISQFGLLELSESQGVNIERENIESDDEDVEETPVNLQPSDSQKTANQSKLNLQYFHVHHFIL